MNGRIERMLGSLGHALPDTGETGGNFLAWRRDGDTVYLAGQTCAWNGKLRFAGPVTDLETGRRAAELCALNLLFNLRAACDGDLDRVRLVLRVGGFVNCRPGFADSPAVIDGASDLLIALYGEAGRHARTAVGVAGLPGDAMVEVDAVVAIR